MLGCGSAASFLGTVLAVTAIRKRRTEGSGPVRG